MEPSRSGNGIASNSRTLSRNEEYLSTPLQQLIDNYPVLEISTRFPSAGATQDYMLHVSKLCQFSGVCRAIAERRISEKKKQRLKLNDLDPIPFSIFVNWLYTQSLMDSHGEYPTFNKLLRLWVFACKLRVPKLQNYVIVVMDNKRVIAKQINSQYLHYVYENTDEGSPLRNYLVDTRHLSEITIPQHYPHQYLVDLYNAMFSEITEEPKASKGRQSRYRYKSGIPMHDHELKRYFVDENIGNVEYEDSEGSDGENEQQVASEKLPENDLDQGRVLGEEIMVQQEPRENVKGLFDANRVLEWLKQEFNINGHKGQAPDEGIVVKQELSEISEDPYEADDEKMLDEETMVKKELKGETEDINEDNDQEPDEEMVLKQEPSDEASSNELEDNYEHNERVSGGESVVKQEPIQQDSGPSTPNAGKRRVAIKTKEYPPEKKQRIKTEDY